MTFLKYLLTAVEVITSILLIVVVLLQKSKSQGAGMAFGAGVGESLFGAQVSNVLTKVTVILAVVFLLNTTGLALLSSHRSAGSVMDNVPTPQPTMPVQAPQGMPPQSQPTAAAPDQGIMEPPAGNVMVPVDVAPVEVNTEPSVPVTE